MANPSQFRKKKPDRRIGQTRRRLANALRRLMEQKPLNKISVHEVLKLAQVSRSAFYAHFDGKVDLLLTDMDEFLERMAMYLVCANEQSERVAPVSEFFAHVGEAENIRGALARSERLQDFLGFAQEHFARGIEARLKQIPRAQHLSAIERSALAHALAGAFLSQLSWWIGKGQPVSPQEMDRRFHQLIWSGIPSFSNAKSAAPLQRFAGNQARRIIRADELITDNH